MPLKLEQCKLATEDLVRLYNQTEAALNEVQKQLPHLWAAPDVAALRNRFAALTKRLTLSSYRIGFVGRSQVGKSSTVNRLLRVGDKDGPGGPGRGAAATSATTRVRILPKTAKHTCTLRYFSQAEFAAFRQRVCERLGLDHTKTNADLIAELTALIQRYEDEQREFQQNTQSHAAAGSGMDARQHDRMFFRKFLEAFELFASEYVLESPRTETADYDQRSDYTNHPREQQASPYQLLFEVRIGFATDAVDTRLEIVDLPGLGAGAVDRIRTETFLRNLDASLIFQSTEHVKSNEAFELMDELRKNFGRLYRRVWMVITKFDNVAAHVLSGDKDGLTILDNIADVLRENFIPQNQVMFAANEFHRLYLERNGEMSPDIYETTLKLKAGPDGKPIIPEALQRHKPLYEAYQKVIEDGGIRHLREETGTCLGDAIQEEVRDAIRRELQDVAKSLVKALEYDRERAQMDDADFTCAARWEALFVRLGDEIDRNRELLERPAGKLIAGLHEKFTEVFAPDQPTPRERLPERHLACMRFLKKIGTIAFRTETAPQIQKKLRTALESFMQRHRLAPLKLPHHASPVDALAERLDGVMLPPTWYEQEFAALENDMLFPQPGATNGTALEMPELDYGEYRTVVAHKLDAVTHRVTHLFGRKLRQQVAELEQELGQLANRSAEGQPEGVKQTYPGLIRQFQDIAGT
jgi:hypothetical protein